LLGDDINIFDSKVAKKYLEIMEGLGVDINLLKSVVSCPGQVVEFAKRTHSGTADVSAISWKMLLANSRIENRAMVALHLAKKGVANLAPLLEVMSLPGVR